MSASTSTSRRQEQKQKSSTRINKHTRTRRTMLAASIAAAATLLAAVPCANAQSTTAGARDDLYGSWSSGFGDVMTGPGFAQPTNFTFTYPNNTGIAYSFDGLGHFEEAQYRFESNGTEPHCVQAVVIWQHGNYTINTNGSISMTPISGDGRIQVQDPCAAETNVITYYDQPTIFQGYAIQYDINHNRNMLRLAAFDGAFLPRLYLFYQPPSMLPIEQLWTAQAYKSYEAANGRSAAARGASLSVAGVALGGLGALAWSLMA